MSPAGAALTQWLTQAEDSLAHFDPERLEEAAKALVDTAAALECSPPAPEQQGDPNEWLRLRARSARLAERCQSLREILAAALRHAATPDHKLSCYRRPRDGAAPLHSLMKRSL